MIPLLKPSSEILQKQNRLDLDEYATDIYEWLSLVRLGSPRLASDDTIDPYLSSYAVPGASAGACEGRVAKISWEGFIAPTWVRKLLAEVILSSPSDAWFSLSVSSLAKTTIGDCTECTVLRPPSSAGEYVLWDVRGHE
jgi:ribonuclease P/MRP protein subunit RPP40